MFINWFDKKGKPSNNGWLSMKAVADRDSSIELLFVIAVISQWRCIVTLDTISGATCIVVWTV